MLGARAPRPRRTEAKLFCQSGVRRYREIYLRLGVLRRKTVPGLAPAIILSTGLATR